MSGKVYALFGIGKLPDDAGAVGQCSRCFSTLAVRREHKLDANNKIMYCPRCAHMMVMVVYDGLCIVRDFTPSELDKLKAMPHLWKRARDDMIDVLNRNRIGEGIELKPTL